MYGAGLRYLLSCSTDPYERGGFLGAITQLLGTSLLLLLREPPVALGVRQSDHEGGVRRGRPHHAIYRDTGDRSLLSRMENDKEESAVMGCTEIKGVIERIVGMEESDPTCQPCTCGAV